MALDVVTAWGVVDKDTQKLTGDVYRSCAEATNAMSPEEIVRVLVVRAPKKSEWIHDIE